MKKTRLLALLLPLLLLASCSGKSSGSKCTGETCRIGDKKKYEPPVIPTEEAVFPE